jgi:S1-C subfamily serine protease
MRPSLMWTTVFLFGLLSAAFAGAQAVPNNASVSAQPVLDAAGPKQRVAIKAVYLVSCAKDNIAGTGFLLSNGLIVTNHHVIGSCKPDELLIISSSNQRVPLSQSLFDEDRDLALLKPSETLSGGFELASDKQPLPGTTVSTWGYPFLYNGYYPLLSVGYVAGYRDAQATPSSKHVKHIVVNGAFNHGNSGGPLLIAQDNKIIGVVVATYHFFPAGVDSTIKALTENKTGLYGNFTTKDASGNTVGLSNDQVVGMILEEFYQKTQVMIGEAISVSELQQLIAERGTEIGVTNTTVKKLSPSHKKSE